MSKAAIIEELEEEQLKTDIPNFRVGDTLRVHIRIIEGTKERIQVFTGTVIARKGAGLSETLILHRVVYGKGMERIFLLHSPKVAKIEVIRRGKVRRSKLYYLRGTYGKKAKVRELLSEKREGSKKKEKVSSTVDEDPVAVKDDVSKEKDSEVVKIEKPLEEPTSE